MILGWRRSGTIAISFLVILSTQKAIAVDNLEVVYQWKELDYAWPNDTTRQLFSHYVRESNNPMGVEVAGDRLFITAPRWSTGVAATLNYIYLNDTSESPLLNPYPSWDAHRFDGDNVPEVVSTFRVWADNCDRLWVLDMGVNGIFEGFKQVVQPALLIYNLSTDKLLRKYVIPRNQTGEISHFGNVVVEESSSCENAFAYLADIRNSRVIVYSWANDDSWLVQHQYFYPDPLAGDFNTSGVSFQWWDGVINFGLAPRNDGYSTLYFHPLCSNAEFAVSTQILQDPKLSTSEDSFHEYVYLGSRGSNGQGAASYLDPTTGILFYALSIANAIACWSPATSYREENIGRVYANNTTMVFPGDIKIDRQGNIWVISNRLPIYMFGEWDSNDFNYRILTGTVAGAVEGTVCSYGIRASQTSGFIAIFVLLVLAYGNSEKLLSTI